MIYTVTVNPSIDYIVRLQNLTLGEVNRMDYDNMLPAISQRFGGHSSGCKLPLFSSTFFFLWHQSSVSPS